MYLTYRKFGLGCQGNIKAKGGVRNYCLSSGANCVHDDGTVV